MRVCKHCITHACAWPQKVVGYVHRHLAQRGHLKKQSVEHSRWRYSLMNW